MALCRFLQERRIRYCVVGDVGEFSSAADRLMEFVVDESLLPLLPAHVANFCDRYEVRLVQYLERHNVCRYVLSWPTLDGGCDYLAFSVGGDYCSNGRRLIAASELLATRQQAEDKRGRRLEFTVPSAAMGFAYHLVKCIDGLVLDETQTRFLLAQWTRNPDAAARHINRLWGSTPEARLLLGAAESDDWSVVRCILPRLRRVLHQRRSWSLQRWRREQARRWRNLREPGGMTIAAIGDEISSRTLLRSAAAKVAPLFQAHCFMQRRPRLLFNSRVDEDIKWNSHNSLGPVAAFKRLLVRADRILGYWLRVRRHLVRASAVYFDRYRMGARFDDKWPRNRLAAGLSHVAARLLPQADLYLVPGPALAAPAMDVERVQGERPIRSIGFEAGLSDEQAAARLAAAITDFMAQRTAQRLERMKALQSNPTRTRWLLFCCRHRVPLLSKLTRMVFNSDIGCKMPRDVSLPHPYGIVIHPRTAIGRRVTLMQQVTLGEKHAGENTAPVLANGVCVGAGAKIFGPVHIGTGAMIGANAVVTQDVPAHATVVGVNRILGQGANVTPIEDYLELEPVFAPSADGVAAAVVAESS